MESVRKRNPGQLATGSIVIGAVLLLACGGPSTDSVETTRYAVTATSPAARAIAEKRRRIGAKIVGHETSTVQWTPGNLAQYQTFENGVMVFTSDVGAVFLSRAIFDHWLSLQTEAGPGGQSLYQYLGIPTRDIATKSTYTEVTFYRGRIIADTTGTPHAVYGDVEKRYATAWQTLGAPTSGVKAGPGGGTYQTFIGGEIYARTSSSVFVVTFGNVYSKWQAVGGVTGALGYPVADTVMTGSIYSGRFENGVIYGAATYTPRVVMSGTLLTEYEKIGGPAGWLGLPKKVGVSLAGDDYMDCEFGVLVIRGGQPHAFGDLKFHLQHVWGYSGDWVTSTDTYVYLTVSTTGGQFPALDARRPTSGDQADFEVNEDWQLTNYASSSFRAHVTLRGIDADWGPDQTLGTIKEDYTIDNLWGLDMPDEHRNGGLKATFRIKNSYPCQNSDFRACQYWSFENFTTDGLGWDSYSAAFTDVGSDDSKWLDPLHYLYFALGFSRIAEPGNCFGMTLESINAQLGRSGYGEPIHQYTKTDSLRRLINTRQGLQLGVNNIVYYIGAIASGLTHEAYSNYLLGATSNLLGMHSMLAIYDSYLFGGGHIVMPYSWDNNKIYIADSNKPLADGEVRAPEYVQIDVDEYGISSSFSYDNYAGGMFTGGRMLYIPYNILEGDQMTPLGTLNPFELLEDGMLMMVGSAGKAAQISDDQGRTLFKTGQAGLATKWEDLQAESSRIPNVAPIPLTGGGAMPGQIYAGLGVTDRTHYYDVVGTTAGAPYQVGVSTATLSSTLVVPGTLDKADRISMKKMNSTDKNVAFSIPADGTAKKISWSVIGMDKAVWTDLQNLNVSPGQEISIHLENGGTTLAIDNDGPPTTATVTAHDGHTGTSSDPASVDIPSGGSSITVQAPVAQCKDVQITASATSCDATVSVDDGSFDPTGGEVTVQQSPAGALPLGESSVVLTATNASGITSRCTAKVTIIDSTPPVFEPAPVDVTAPCRGTPNLGPVKAVDACGGAVVVTNDAPAQFGLGTTTVTWKATDAAGNTATATQNVTVRPFIDLGPEHAFTSVPNNTCVNVSQYPSSWAKYVNSLIIQPQAQGVGWPIPFKWTNCGNSGTSMLPGPWQQGTVRPVNTTCNTILELGGDGAGAVTLTWWANG